MAFGMKHIVGAMVAGCLLVAALALPPQQRYTPGWQLAPAERLNLETLERDLRDTGEILRRVQWADSLVPLIADPSAPPVQVLYPAGHGLAPIQVERMADLVGADVERYGGSGDVRFGLVWQPHNMGQYPGMSIAGQTRDEIYAGEYKGEPYCIRINVVHRASVVGRVSDDLAGRRSVGPETNVLGLCGWYLRYGLPSASVETWLSVGGAEFGRERGENPDVRVYPMRAPFGYQWERQNLAAKRCQAGRAEACAVLFERPKTGSYLYFRNERVVEESPLLWARFVNEDLLLSEFQEYLFDDLEREFGHEAFARFWTSEKKVSEAFQEAFGISAGEWMVDWLERTRGLEYATPALPRHASTGGMVTILLLLGLAYRAQRQRRVV